MVTVKSEQLGAQVMASSDVQLTSHIVVAVGT
jgi:hypothetical protein